MKDTTGAIFIIEGKSYAFNVPKAFNLKGKKYLVKDVENDVEKYNDVLQHLLEIEGQNILVEVQPKEEKAKTTKNQK